MWIPPPAHVIYSSSESEAVTHLHIDQDQRSLNSVIVWERVFQPDVTILLGIISYEEKIIVPCLKNY